MAASSLSMASTVVVDPTAFGPSASVVTFETGTTALPEVPGLNFVSSIPASGTWFAAAGNFPGFFGDQGASNLVSASYSDIAVNFANSQYVVGAWLGNIPNFTQTSVSSLTVEVFGAQAVSLGSFQVAIPAGIGQSVFFGVASTEGIQRVEWRGGNVGFFGLDNLSYQAQPVPEPSSAALLLSGAALLACLRRRAASWGPARPAN
ncbi:PEP-CTERM sorting domain-containing protein [Paucibacter sp. Y2R2-4]|uniref:PEP-CTERM sorting domain-containing protein n=1 Tax=Paucibacter sp. Y2R2-4 TaxID=2893553 RepID=UPI0021E37153|nr:PEP-CTERM sorting domain-containing protein [Paucibacter sp. Y2R2-4]MCV2350676.1 PEP-CTERM sorting domain-containing protein [Paucibacter sp. Y2R2-4]